VAQIDRDLVHSLNGERVGIPLWTMATSSRLLRASTVALFTVWAERSLLAALSACSGVSFGMRPEVAAWTSASARLRRYARARVMWCSLSSTAQCDPVQKSHLPQDST
jgi:hypothetical protein